MWEVDFKSLLSFLHFIGLATNPMPFKKPPLQKATLDNAKSPNNKNKSYANLSLFFVATLPHKGVPHLSRLDIEAKVRSMMGNTSCGLPPLPLEVKINGPYVLLSETYIIMERKQLEKKKHYGTSHEIGNKWHFKQHVYFNIWSMISLSISEYITTLLPYWVYHLLLFCFFLTCCPSHRLVED